MSIYYLVSPHALQLQQCPVGSALTSPKHSVFHSLESSLACLALHIADEQVPLLQLWCDEHHVDMAPQSFLRTDIGLLAMDMDSTLITIECIDEIADFVGVKSEVAAITEAAMEGKIPFTEALHQRVALLAGLPVETLESVFNLRLKLSAGAETMLAEFKALGVYTLLVSGGFTFFTDRLKAQLGLDEAHANVLEVVDGHLTGRIIGKIVDGAAKAEHVKRVRAQLENQANSMRRRVIAVGDGSNDRLMFAEADAGIAYHAKPVLEAVATHRIRYSGLDTLLAFFPALQP